MGSEIKHTPGPWVANGTAVETSEDKDGMSTWVASCNSRGTGDEAEELANAKLIAAAPSLRTELEQSTWRLRNALTWMPADCAERQEIERQIDANQAAITKATA